MPEDVNLTVEQGEVVVIIGPSGVGKSTFLRSLNCLEKIMSGRIFIEDELFYHRENDKTVEKMEAKKNKQLLLEMGMVFQRFKFWRRALPRRYLQIPSRPRQNSF